MDRQRHSLGMKPATLSTGASPTQNSAAWVNPGHIPEYRPSLGMSSSPIRQRSGITAAQQSATQTRSQSEPARIAQHGSGRVNWNGLGGVAAPSAYAAPPSADDIFHHLGVSPLSPTAASFSSASLSFSRLPDIPETCTLHSVSALASSEPGLLDEECLVNGEVAMEVFVACLNEGIGVLDLRPLEQVHRTTNFLLGKGPDQTRTRRRSAAELAGLEGRSESSPSSSSSSTTSSHPRGSGAAMIWRISKYLHMNREDLLQRLYELPATSEALMIVVQSSELCSIYKDLCVQRRYQRVIFINDTCFIRHCLALCQRSLRISLAFESTLQPRVHEYTPLFNANVILEQCFAMISERIALWNHSEQETTNLLSDNDNNDNNDDNGGLKPGRGRTMKKRAMIHKRADCLDIGCGTGRDAVWMALQQMVTDNGRSSPVSLQWHVYCVDKNDKVLKTLNTFRAMSKTVDQITIQKVKIRKDGCMVVCPPLSKLNNNNDDVQSSYLPRSSASSASVSSSSSLTMRKKQEQYYHLLNQNEEDVKMMSDVMMMNMESEVDATQREGYGHQTEEQEQQQQMKKTKQSKKKKKKEDPMMMRDDGQQHYSSSSLMIPMWSKLEVQWDMKARRFGHEPVPFETPFDYGRKFDLIQSVRFLDRKVLAEFVPYQLKNSGFVLIYTFMVGAEKFGKPKKAEYLLKPGELIQLFCGDYFIDEVTRLGNKTWKCPDTGYYFKFQLIHNDENVRLPDGRPMQGFVARKVVL